MNRQKEARRWETKLLFSLVIYNKLINYRRNFFFRALPTLMTCLRTKTSASVPGAFTVSLRQRTGHQIIILMLQNGARVGACQGHEPNTSVYTLRNDRGQCMTCMQRRGGVVCRSAGKFARLRWQQGALRNGPSLHTEGIQRDNVWYFSQQHTGRSVGPVVRAKINTLYNTKLSSSTRNSINPYPANVENMVSSY